MFILYDNLLDDATLTIPDENIYYGADNLKDTRLSKYYRSNSLISNIVIDLGSAKQVTSFFIVDHSFTSSATVRLQANTSDSWGSPPVDIILSITDYIMYNYTIDETYQYWRLTFDDNTNPDFVRIGRIMMGVPLSGLRMQQDQRLTVKTTTDTTTNKTGQKFIRIGYEFNSNSINLQNITFDKEQEIKTMFRAAGNRTPVILVIWENEIDKQAPLYCFITDTTANLQRKSKFITPFAVSFNFEQTF